MFVRQVTAGTTDVSVIIRIIDSADGTPETGVQHDTSGIDLKYRREGAAVVDITEAALSALTDAHSDGGIEHISGGYYRLDLPDDACASGATGVWVGGTITGMVVIGCYVELVAFNPHDAAGLGLSRLDATVGSRSTQTSVDTIDENVDSILADTAELQTDWADGGRLDDILDARASQASVDTVDENVDSVLAAVDTEVAAALAAVDTEVAAIKAKTDNLPASPAAVGSAMALTTGERTAVADALLDRDMSAGTDTGTETVRTVRQALRFLRNKWAVIAGILSVYKENDSDVSWTAEISSDAEAEPVTGSDPTSS